MKRYRAHLTMKNDDMAEIIKCEPDLVNIISTPNNSSRPIKIEKPTPDRPPRPKKQKMNPSPGLNLKETRNNTPKTQKKKSTAKPKPEPTDVPTEATPKVRMTAHEKRLAAKTGERQGVDIRKFFVPCKVEMDNRPPAPLPLPTKKEPGPDSNIGTTRANGTGNISDNTAQRTDPSSITDDEATMMEFSFDVDNNTETPIVSSLDQEESTLMDLENSETGRITPNMGNWDFIVSKESEIIITDIRSIAETVIPIVDASNNVEVKPDLTVKTHQGITDDILFHSSNELPDMESNIIAEEMTDVSTETFEVTDSVAQFDEVSSTGVKPRSRANSFSSSTSKSSLKRKKSDSEDIRTALKNKNWTRVFEIFCDYLNDNMLPAPAELALVIGNCLLKSEGRVSAHSQCSAADFFEKFVESATSVDEEVELMLDALDLVKLGSPHDRQNSYWEVISKIFDEVKTEAESKLTKRVAFSFLHKFFLILEKSYQSYLKRTVKLKLPGIARIFEGPVPKSVLNPCRTIGNFKSLLEQLFQLENYPDELGMSIDWVSLVASHFYNFNTSDAVPKGLVIAFVEVVSDRKTDYGLPILRKLKKNIYVKDIIRKIVEREFTETQLQPEVTKLEFLEKMSESRCVTVHDIYENAAITKFCKNNSSNNGSGDPWMKCPPNTKGESYLHIACGDKQRAAVKRIHFQDLQERVRRMKADQIEDINVPDNALNTPLHDAAYYGRDDVITLFREEQLYIPNAEPGHLNLNLLAKNQDGDTPLHLAAKRGHRLFIETLIAMCVGHKEQLFRLLQSKNNDGQTPLDTPDSSVRSYLQEHMPIMEEENFIYAGISLSEASISKLESKTDLQKLIGYWRHLHRKRV